MRAFLRSSQSLATPVASRSALQTAVPRVCTQINSRHISSSSGNSTPPSQNKSNPSHNRHTYNFLQSPSQPLPSGLQHCSASQFHSSSKPRGDADVAAPPDADPETIKTIFGEFEPSELVELSVNGKSVLVPSGVTVLQACEAAGVNIPRFCYHDRLSIAGNCRMCLVEVEKAKKPVASCANPIMPGMKIKTDTEMVKFAREGTVELLLANHPLDCPICDQGGECDLQDITITFGSLEGRYRETRRAVEDKDLGPFVKTVMARCIHCTRCIRFADEIAGNEMLGTCGRGNATEVGTYIDAYFDSELSGNVIDLCPVGALTNKPSAFKVRPWDLEVKESIDALDAVGANLVMDTRFNELIRIKPRLNEDVNEEWLSDKSRFFVDGLKRQRLDMPLVKDADGLLQPATWPEALKAVSDKMTSVHPSQMKALAGDLCDVESMLALKDLFNYVGSNNTESRQDHVKISPDFRTDYIFNGTIPGIEVADVCLLVGTNPRMEAPLINARLRKAYLNGLDVFVVGHDAYLNYEKDVIGDTLSALADIASGKSEFTQVLSESEQPMIVVGMSALQGDHYELTMSLLDELRSKYPNLCNDDWNGISFLQTRSGRNAALDIGFVPGPDASDKDIQFFYNMGGDEYDDADIPDSAFVVYQGSHGDKGAGRADVVFPGSSYVEKNGTYVNVDGRVQRTKQAIGGPGSSRIDWQIIRALAEVTGIDLPYENITQLRERLFDIAPHFARLDTIDTPVFMRPTATQSGLQSSAVAKAALNQPFNRYFDNYFLTDAITRSSKVLRRAAKDLPLSTNSWK